MSRRERPAAETAAEIDGQFGSGAPERGFDVFLCHSARAADKALGVWQLLSEPPYRFHCYLDWIRDPLLEREAVTPETAAVLRRRMQDSQCLIYIASDEALESVWMPWELGYFDAFKANVGVLPVLRDPNAQFVGHEYLSLYTPLTLDAVAAMTRARSPDAAAGGMGVAEDFQRGAARLAWAAQQLDLNEFARLMKDRPRLAGEWLRPHARATVEKLPAMSAAEPAQASEEANAAASIYVEEWLRLWRHLSGLDGR